VKTFETYKERKTFIEELKQQWKTLWLERIDDEVRAEGISNRDYLDLFVERGTVIVATGKFKAPNFYDIVQKHLSSDQRDAGSGLTPDPKTGGWGKFVRNVLDKQPSVKRKRGASVEANKRAGQQLKKSGRGWLHFRK
jgi:hypothetical protein